MTGLSRLFSSSSSCTDNENIKIANRSLPVIGSIGYVFISPTLTVTPLPPPGRREGAWHGTEIPLPDFLTLVGLFRNINPNL